MISESIGSKVIPVSRLNKLAEKMPYLTSLKLISDTGSVDFHHGESSVSTAELMSALPAAKLTFDRFKMKFVLVRVSRKLILTTVRIF